MLSQVVLESYGMEGQPASATLLVGVEKPLLHVEIEYSGASVCPRNLRGFIFSCFVVQILYCLHLKTMVS